VFSSDAYMIREHMSYCLPSLYNISMWKVEGNFLVLNLSTIQKYKEKLFGILDMIGNLRTICLLFFKVI
jgi:hypothetical protein